MPANPGLFGNLPSQRLPLCVIMGMQVSLKHGDPLQGKGDNRMPFGSYGSVAEVARAHHLHYARADFVRPLPTSLPNYFRSELTFTLREIPFQRSDRSAGEAVIYPFLREVWKPFRDTLTLCSHEAITYDEDLCGTPDYLVSRRSPLGSLVLDPPYLALVVQAKRDDFCWGWGQCAAAMLAALRINDTRDQTAYGIVTNGQLWEFGHLQGQALIQDVRGFSLQDLDQLAGAIHFTLAQCRAQVVAAEPCPT